MEVKKEKKKKLFIYKFITIITLLLSISYLIYVLIKIDNLKTNIIKIVFPIFVLLISLLLFISAFTKNDNKMTVLFQIIIIIFLSFCFLSNENIILLPKEEEIISYVNKPYEELNNWANNKNINLIVEYEYSDTIEINNIIRTSINEGAYVKDINEMTVTISKGPDYDKIVIVPSMIGRNIDDIINFVNNNYIIGLTIDYEFSDEEKNTVIKQSNNGDIRRDQQWNIVMSLGNKDELEKNIEMINLKNKSLFDCELWLKQNNIKYEIKYEFKDDIERNTIFEQSINELDVIDIDLDTVTLTVSKGKAIIVPDILNMNVNEVTEWISNNKLKVSFDEIYDENIEIGKIISANVNKDAQLEINSLVNITVSKGQIKMQKFNTLYDFKEWANKYNINYNESYEYSDNISKGEVISYSYSESEIVNPDDTIYIKISLGKAVVIPSFIGKSKSEASALCNSIGIKCTFTTGGYTNYNENVVYAQSRNTGNKVTSGSTINLTLSKGIPETKKLFIQSNWLIIGNADSTIQSLKAQFAKNFPGVNFNFEKVKDNVLSSGTIRKDSPTNVGTLVTQGKTYTIYVVSN